MISAVSPVPMSVSTVCWMTAHAAGDTARGVLLLALSLAVAVRPAACRARRACTPS